MSLTSMNALKLIRDAKSALQDQIAQQGLTGDAKTQVDKAIFLLDDEEDIIINTVVGEMGAVLNAKNKDLLDLLDNMKRSADKLDKVGDIVQKIADAVGVLAEITGKAVSAGLL